MLWDAEIESMRPAIAAEAPEFIAEFLASRDVDADLPAEEQLAAVRTAYERSAVRSDNAVDIEIEGPAGPLRLRTFRPDGPARAVMLHIHGGGWVVGSPEMNDQLNEVICAAKGIAVVSVDYRLAPEHPYPAAPDDCETVACWLLEEAAAEFGAEPLLIGGESAGAHLAAVTLLRMRDRHGQIGRFVGANLVFGVYDLTGPPSQRGVVSDGDILDPDQMAGFIESFTPGLAGEERASADVSPAFADLAGMPPALFTVGTSDHLYDDTLLLAGHWAAAGSDTGLLIYPGAPHGGIALPSVSAHWFPRLLEFVDSCI